MEKIKEYLKGKLPNSQFTVYDDFTVLQLLWKTIFPTLENMVTDLGNKTELYGDHKGSWQGLSKPTLSEEGMRATVEKLNEDVKTIKNDLDGRELVYRGSYNSLKDLLEKCSDVTKRGGVIYFPSGIFEIAPFELGDRIKLKGCGIGSTILKQQPNTVGDFITICDNNNFSSIEEITIDGNKQNCSVGGNGVTIKSVDTWNKHDKDLVVKKLKQSDTYAHFYLNNVMIRNCRKSGLNVEQIRYAIRIDNLHSKLNDEHGVYNLSTDNMFSNMYCEENGMSGIYEGGKNNKWSVIKAIWNGKADRSLGGVYIKGNNNNFISVESQDNYTHGFHINIGGGNTLIGCMADANGYLDYDNSTNEHFGFYLNTTYKNKLLGCVVANYREKPFMKKPFVITGHSNSIDIDVIDNSCIDMKPINGNANKGTKDLSDKENIWYIDNMGVVNIAKTCYFEITGSNDLFHTFPLPINFTNTISCNSEILYVNTGGIIGKSAKIRHNAEIIDDGGIKKLKIHIVNETGESGIWAIDVRVKIEGY